MQITTRSQGKKGFGKTKTTLILLALIFLMTGCVAGGTNEGLDKPDEASRSDAVSSIGNDYLTSQQWLDMLEKKDYDGYRYIIATTQAYVVVPEEGSESLIDAAAYERNLMVEEKYNVKITEMLYEKSELLPSQLNAALSDTAIGDVILAPGEEIAVLADVRQLLNLYSLPYFNPSSEYIDQYFVKAGTLSNTMYALYGGIHNVSNNLWATFYNKDLLDEYSLDDPYDAVVNGEWTWDVYLEMARTVADKTISKTTPNLNSDIFGFTTYFNTDDPSFAYAIWQSGGQSYFGDTYRSDKLTISIDVDFAEAVRSKMRSVTVNNKAMYTGSGSTAIEAFCEGRILFYSYEAALASTFIDKDFNWGVAPMPKATAEQKDYHCWVDVNTLAAAVPSSVPDSERTGLILSALYAASYESVEESVKQTYLNYYLSDNKSAVMLFNYIFNKPQLDPVHIYGAGMQEIGKETYDIMQGLLTSSAKISSRLLSSSNIALIEAALKEKFK